jgi:hypothetical protein
MAIRQCLQCGGELVLAFRPSEIGRLIPGTAGVIKSNATGDAAFAARLSLQINFAGRRYFRPVEQEFDATRQNHDHNQSQ